MQGAYVIDTAGLAFPKLVRPTKAQHKYQRQLREGKFRAAVWLRDHSCDRATGRPLFHVAQSDEDLGEVCHLRGRRVAPELALNPRNAVLLSAAHHRLSDGRGNNRLKLTDPQTGLRAADAFKPITFTLYDKSGNVVWARTR